MTYEIKQGNHYSSFELPSFHRWNNNVFKRKAIFYSDCMYEDIGKSGHINKLYGISQGFPHQADYLLFGWRARTQLGGIELLPYRHVDWKRIYNAADPEPFIVKPGEAIMLTIDTTDPAVYIFRANDREWRIPRERKPWCPIGYTLKPYFGGTPVAPHTMHIQMEKL